MPERAASVTMKATGRSPLSIFGTGPALAAPLLDDDEEPLPVPLPPPGGWDVTVPWPLGPAWFMSFAQFPLGDLALCSVAAPLNEQACLSLPLFWYHWLKTKPSCSFGSHMLYAPYCP